MPKADLTSFPKLRVFHFLRTDYIPNIEKNRKILTHLTGPLASKGFNEYDTVVEGAWRAEVDRLLTKA